MRLVVGLGNPGERYRRTRHNVGFMVVDTLAHRGGAEAAREEAEAWVATTRLAGAPALLVKPLTFMNRSGAAVGRLAETYAAGPEELLVIEDDVALELGTLRVRARGSHGGHNGLRSILDVLGTEEVARVRVGVRRGELPDDLAGYVLSDFEADEVLVVQEVVGWAVDAVECWARDGVEAAMSRFNGPRQG